ncbi:hypothetical protein GCM10027093_08620 [Paraburkholderia jirisanensis]
MCADDLLQDGYQLISCNKQIRLTHVRPTIHWREWGGGPDSDNNGKPSRSGRTER